MGKMMTMTRLWGTDRFDKYAPEIVLAHGLLEDTAKLLSDTRSPKARGDVDFGLQDFNHIKHLLVFSEGFGLNTRAEKALLFEYNGTNYSKSSILEFAEPGTWTKADFKRGKTDPTTRATLRTAANNDPYLWEDFDNLFVLWRINLMLQQVGMILHSEQFWKEDRDVATVVGCAGLLWGKIEECIDQFRTKTGGVTEEPHRKFYEGSKIAETIVFRVPSPPKTPSSKKTPGIDTENPEELLRDLDEDGEIREEEGRKKRKRGGKGKRGDEKEIGDKGDKGGKGDLVCYLSLTEILQLKNKEGETRKCGNKECKFKHRRSLAEITQTEARVAGKAWIRDSEVRNSLKEAIAAVPDGSWKTATAPPPEIAGAEQKRRRVALK
ncbi:hypothetical protein B484DRAFT_410485 [Ochromonadaceae sp. CCMP2298]|nr:hypothetical protein B484DRAFT_410485 [Ochromonadaceae sp. CCMP2298]